MVTGVNKWWSAAAISLIFMFQGPERERTEITSAALHPLHLSVTDIEWNTTDKSLEISCKLFTDDFENILERTYNVDIDLVNPKDRPAVQKVVNDYIQKHLVLKVDDKPVQFTCIGFERDHEATYSYLEATNITAVSRVQIMNSLMYDLFDDQANIMHVKVEGKRKSTKLNYPAKDANIAF